MHDLMMNAVQGDGDAAFQVGSAYENGTYGLAKDLKEAHRYYLMGATSGNIKAQFNLASMYEAGRGCSADPRQAYLWYEKAAEQGEWEAQYNLGLFLTDGKGCDVDTTLAHMWFSVAATSGNSDALHNRDALADFIKPDQLAISNQWVIDWVNQPWKKTRPSIQSTPPKKEFRDAQGNLLKDGDTVILVKPIKIKGSDKVIKVGAVIKNIYIEDADYEITCKMEGFGTFRLKKEFVKKA